MADPYLTFSAKEAHEHWTIHLTQRDYNHLQFEIIGEDDDL